MPRTFIPPHSTQFNVPLMFAISISLRFHISLIWIQNESQSFRFQKDFKWNLNSHCLQEATAICFFIYLPTGFIYLLQIYLRHQDFVTPSVLFVATLSSVPSLWLHLHQHWTNMIQDLFQNISWFLNKSNEIPKKKLSVAAVDLALCSHESVRLLMDLDW